MLIHDESEMLIAGKKHVSKISWIEIKPLINKFMDDFQKKTISMGHFDQMKYINCFFNLEYVFKLNQNQ